MVMEITEKLKSEGLIKYAEGFSESYAKKYKAEIRKIRGQFFTPYQVSRFMANLFAIRRTTIRLLDPGAGTGTLTAAFCERLLASNKTVDLTIDAYENDPILLPFLTKVLTACKCELEKKGHTVKYNIYQKDFILYNEGRFRKSSHSWNDDKQFLYDFIISNPPYYKLNKDSPHAAVMIDMVSGQPNIYALFMGLATRMIRDGGQMVFITPRSFCSGLYYRKFRHWFIDTVKISNIHVFESRKDIFDKDKVLQENVILKVAKPKRLNPGKITISISRDKTFKELKKIKVNSEDVISHKNGDIFIRIPTCSLDVDILHSIDKWPRTINDLGLEISTGPVVSFRAKQYLLQELKDKPNSAPLLWMHNMQDARVIWPLQKNNKPTAIHKCDKTKPILLPVKNYVLLKRFTSKEQNRRLYASLLLESEFPFETVGIENHLNYIHKPAGSLSLHEAFGISALLNTTLIDNFFRSLNGNTQVNASDIRCLPLPDIEDIRQIGKIVYNSKTCNGELVLDDIVGKKLGISPKIIEQLKMVKKKNGKSR